MEIFYIFLGAVCLSVHPCCSVCAHRKVRSLLFLSHSRPPLVLNGWLRVGVPGHRRDHCRLLPQGVALGVLRQHMESRSKHKCQVRSLFAFSSLSLCHFLPISCQLLNTFPFKILFPQNFFSTFCHQQKECTVSSLAGLVCQKPQKKDRPAFAKCSSVLFRMPRKSAD